MKKYAIGIDVGGTKISMVLGTNSGKILARRIIPTQTGKQTSSCLQALAANLKILLQESAVKKSQVLGIGVGIPGPVDTEKSVAPRSPHLSGWENFQLGKFLKRQLGLPVVMANDANAAVLGEKVFGQGKQYRHFIYMTVSTGIGGGLVVNGQLVEGASYVAGEVGHMTIVPQGNRCKCGKQGCLEAYASGTAIAQYVKDQLKRGRSSRIPKLVGKGEKLAAYHVGLAARKNDPLAVEAYKRAGYYLGIGIANLLNILNPEIVILGGGVLKSASKSFWQAMKASCKRESWPQAFHAARIVQTQLKDQAGDLGAMALVFENIRTNK